MRIEKFSSLESEVLSNINKGFNTFETLLDNLTFGEKLLSQTLESLISRNVLKLNLKNKHYEYCSPIEDNEMVILDGNILLPTVIIKVPEKNIMYVTRGNWYQFPIDFDVRRIIWNVRIVGKNNSTLVDMIKSSILKERKTKIKHNPDYDSLKNKAIPYCKEYSLIMNAISDEVTDVTIRFNFYFNDRDTQAPVFKGFKVNSEIDTQELLSELRKDLKERNYLQNIKVNKIYNLSDFIFKGNEIPINFINNELQFVTITGVKKGYELTYYVMGYDGVTKKVDVEHYENPEVAIEKIHSNILGFASMLLDKSGFLIDEQN